MLKGREDENKCSGWKYDRWVLNVVLVFCDLDSQNYLYPFIIVLVNVRTRRDVSDQLFCHFVSIVFCIGLPESLNDSLVIGLKHILSALQDHLKITA